MDAKMNPSRAKTEASTSHEFTRKRLFSFVQSIKDELVKVSWTSREELKTSAKAVIGSIFLFGMGIYLFDLIIKGFLDFIALVVHFIFG